MFRFPLLPNKTGSSMEGSPEGSGNWSLLAENSDDGFARFFLKLTFFLSLRFHAYFLNRCNALVLGTGHGRVISIISTSPQMLAVEFWLLPDKTGSSRVGSPEGSGNWALLSEKSGDGFARCFSLTLRFFSARGFMLIFSTSAMHRFWARTMAGSSAPSMPQANFDMNANVRSIGFNTTRSKT